jgi:hypothetical protein
MIKALFAAAVVLMQLATAQAYRDIAAKCEPMILDYAERSGVAIDETKRVVVTPNYSNSNGRLESLHFWLPIENAPRSCYIILTYTDCSVISAGRRDSGFFGHCPSFRNK